MIVLGGVVFTAGYFWGQNKGNQECAPGSHRLMRWRGMAGMNMSPGTAMVSPQMQQLMGVRTAIVEAKTLSKTVRAVGTVTYDESTSETACTAKWTVG